MSSNGDKKGVSFEGQVELAAALEYLKSLYTGLKKGTAYVQNGTDYVALEPPATVKLEIEARSKKEKQGIKLSISWERDEEVMDAPSALTISDKEPELVGVIDDDE